MADATSLFQSRRDQLARMVQKPILLVGNGSRPRNLPMSAFPFRQDSSFLYLSGIKEPDAAMLIDVDGTSTLFLREPPADDALWHGKSLPIHEKGRRYGFTNVEAFQNLENHTLPPNTLSLAVPDAKKNALLNTLLNRTFEFGTHFGDDELVDAIISLRRTKGPTEISQLQEAADASVKAHLAVMMATRPEVTERALAALFQGVLAAEKCTLGYPTILTVKGEVLHQFHYHNTLRAGDLLLIDGGGEMDAGYGVDITRTYPVSGRFDARQRAVYEVVLEAQKQSIQKCTPGTPYREVHDTSSLVLAQFLKDEGITHCSPEESVEIGLHALVFPHGVGHHLGLDVHDLENFGDRPSYPKGVSRPEAFGTRYLRLNLPLEPNWVVTVEPGFYIVDSILDEPNLRQKFAPHVNFGKLDEWRGFGGIRIEDDIVVQADGPKVLTQALPKEVSDIERIVGQGPSVTERLGVSLPGE